MQLKKEHLEQIGEYVRKQLPEWIDSIPRFSVSANMELLERIVRIKDQREIMLRGFEQADKQFELMQITIDKQFKIIQESADKQFYQINKSLSLITKMMLFGFSLMSAAISVAIALIHFSKV